jgi:hypothetical protein
LTSAWWKLDSYRKFGEQAEWPKFACFHGFFFLGQKKVYQRFIGGMQSMHVTVIATRSFCISYLGIFECDGTKYSVNYHLVGCFSMLDLGLSGQLLLLFWF